MHVFLIGATKCRVECDGELDTVLLSLQHYSTKNLGFMQVRCENRLNVFFAS